MTLHKPRGSRNMARKIGSSPWDKHDNPSQPRQDLTSPAPCPVDTGFRVCKGPVHQGSCSGCFLQLHQLPLRASMLLYPTIRTERDTPCPAPDTQINCLLQNNHSSPIPVVFSNSLSDFQLEILQARITQHTEL